MGEGGADSCRGALELRRGGREAGRRVHSSRLLQSKLATSREALFLWNNKVKEHLRSYRVIENLIQFK